jgi:hypothetical protein
LLFNPVYFKIWPEREEIMDHDKPVKPQQKVCEKNVEVPTLLVEPLTASDWPMRETFVQWFGRADGADLGERQFRFPVPLHHANSYWHGHPLLWKVTFLGTFRSFPWNPKSREMYREVAPFRDNPGTGILVAHLREPKHPEDPELDTFGLMIPMTIHLTNSERGIITPQEYRDRTVFP